MAEKIIAEYELKTDKFRQQIKGVADDLGKVEKQGKEAGDANTKSFNNAAQSANKFGKSVKDSESQLQSIKGMATKFAGAVGIAFGVQEVLQFTKATIDAASNLNETFTKTQQLFGANTDQIMEWSKTTANSLGQSQQQALDAASTFAIFGRSAGLTGEDLVKFSTDFTGLASDLASFNNTTPEEAIEAIGAALRGENEPIRRYGVLLDEASLKQAALKEGIISSTKEALTPQQKVLAAQIAIYQQTTAAQGDFARTSDGLANQQRILAANFANLQAEIGQALLPVMLDFVKTLNSLVKGDIPGMIDGLGKLNDKLNPLGLGIGGLVNMVENMSEAFKLVTDGDFSGAIEKLGEAFLDLNGALNPFVAVLRYAGTELLGLNNELSEAEQLEQRLEARQNTFNNAILEGGDALEIFRKRAKEVLGATDKQFDDYVATQRKRLEASQMNNEEDKKTISLLKQMQQEVSAITERITQQILTGGPISQKDIDRVNELEKKLKELPIIVKAVKEGVDGVVADETIEITPPDDSFLNSVKSTNDLRLEETNRFLEERFMLEMEDDERRRMMLEEYAALEAQYNQQRTDAAFAVADGVLSAFSSVFNALAEDNEEFAKFQKALAVIDVTLKAAQAVAAATASAAAGDPYTVAIRIAAAVAAVGAAIGTIVSTVKSSQVPSAPAFASGTDFVQRGKNKAGVDTIPAYLNEGEAVIPTDKNKAYPGLAKAWIAGNLDDYIVRNFVAPKLIDMERKAEKRMADSFAASLKGDGFDDARLLMATSEGNMYLKTIAKEMKTKQKKRTAW